MFSLRNKNPFVGPTLGGKDKSLNKNQQMELFCTCNITLETTDTPEVLIKQNFNPCSVRKSKKARKKKSKKRREKKKKKAIRRHLIRQQNAPNANNLKRHDEKLPITTFRGRQDAEKIKDNYLLDVHRNPLRLQDTVDTEQRRGRAVRAGKGGEIGRESARQVLCQKLFYSMRDRIPF